MIRPFATALLLGGLATLALPAGSSTAFSADEMQPEPQAKKPTSVYVYSGGHSYLGVDIRDVSSDRVSALKLKEERGVEITMVDQDAPAGKAGLKEHDVILEFNGAAVDSEEQLRRMIREVPPGRTVALGISRDGSPMKISVKLAAHEQVMTDGFQRITVKPLTHMPPQMDVPGFPFQVQSYSSVLGLQTESLTRQLGEFFGVQNGEGILVRSVEKGSAGEKAGLKAGDVIVRADNEKLSGRMDLANILRKHHEGGKITLGVVRDKHEQAFVVTVPERGPWDSSFFDLDSLSIDSEKLQASLGSAMKEIEKAGGWANLDLDMPKIKLEELGRELQKITPETKKAMRKAEEEMKRVQKQLEKQQHDFKFDWDPFI